MSNEEPFYEKRLCSNPQCKFKVVHENDIHPSGMCMVCCLKYGPMTCPICWTFEDFDE